jgi:thiol-disulfide isomerase/thioredoxin
MTKKLDPKPTPKPTQKSSLNDVEPVPSNASASNDVSASTSTQPYMRLVTFTSKVCGACVMMKRAGVLEKFAAAHPEVELVDYCVADENGETPEGSEYEENDKLADEYDISHLPTLIFETPDGGELIRIENPMLLKLPKLEEIYAKQKALLEAKRRARRG